VQVFNTVRLGLVRVCSPLGGTGGRWVERKTTRRMYMISWWMIPFILLGGALQTCGAAMNGQLNRSLVNPWLASLVSFAMVTFFFAAMFLVYPSPLPKKADWGMMPWWAPVGGLVGAVQVYAGLTLVNRVGTGMYMALTVTSAILMSLLVDHFGWFRITPHPLTLARVLGGTLMIMGVFLVSRY
jgi:transporter family-2 protein